MRSQSVQQKTPINAVHASEQNVALRYGTNDIGIPEISVYLDHPGLQTCPFNRVRLNVDLESFFCRILHSRIQNTIDITVFHVVVVDNYELPYAQPNQLLDNWTAGARSTNDCYRQTLQPLNRALAEDLRMRSDEAWCFHIIRVCVPEMKIIACDADTADLLQ